MMNRFLRPSISKRRSFLASAAAALLLLASAYSSAQTDQGAITGVVQDSTGAVIPNAQVTATSIDTGLALQTKSNNSGVFVFSPLKIGNYTVSASMQGFQTVSHENLHLDIQQRLNVNFTLQTGGVTETVKVTSDAPVLETQEAAVGQVISTKEINDTPLNGRNWVYI